MRVIGPFKSDILFGVMYSRDGVFVKGFGNVMMVGCGFEEDRGCRSRGYTKVVIKIDLVAPNGWTGDYLPISCEGFGERIILYDY